MTSERSKRRDFLSLIFISKSISKKLLISLHLICKNPIKTQYYLFTIKIQLPWSDFLSVGHWTNHTYLDLFFQ